MAASGRVLTMTGQRLGHYRIVEKIGAGGMGEVYRACDEQLDRDVALKVLPTSSFRDEVARARLLREARAAAALNHPHICTIYEVGEADGQAYIAMELVEGQPLSVRLAGAALPPEQVVRYGLQLADALAHAHEHGVVHRDLKGANVTITPEGRAKVLDFGLAKRVTGEELDEATRSQASLTQPGAIVGTLAYMAPEQLRGQPADARSDIWALGVILYEMAAGTRPFRGQTGFELSSAILNREPGPLGGRIPVELRTVIERCLAKEPGRRYQRAGEVRAALEAVRAGAVAPWVTLRYRAARWRWPALAVTMLILLAVVVGLNVGGLRDRLWGGPAGARIESLAVLPLENLSRDPEQDYFADGMTEALITDLSRLGGLRRVIARGSVMRYKGAHTLLSQIARELRVDGLITGSVLRVGDRVRITAQLIEAPTDTALWAESYERDLRDILALQREVARSIAAKVKVTLTPEEKARLTGARRVDPEAYEAYLKGRFYWNKRTEEALKLGLKYFENAIARAPTYASAYAGMADSYAMLGAYGFLAPAQAYPRAKAAALQALEIDDAVAEAYTSLLAVRIDYEWDWPGVEDAFRRAVAINPNYATAHQWYGLYLQAMGRMEEGRRAQERALELDRLSLIINTEQGQYSYFNRAYDQAIRQYQSVLEIDPDFPRALWLLGLAYSLQGRNAQAIKAQERGVAVSGRHPRFVAGLAYALARGSREGEARRLVRELDNLSENGRYVSALDRAIIFVGLGEKEEAVAWLEKAYSERSWGMYRLKVEPLFDPLRDDPRFQDLLRRMNFPR